MLLLLAAPLVCLQAAVNAGADDPRWAHRWNGFRMAEDARGRLSGDPENPQAGLRMAPGAAKLARGAYAREPLASDAVFVLALAQAPLSQDYEASAGAEQGARLDKRNALLQLLMIADAASREDFPALFDHADILAATHPGLGNAVLAPLFDKLGNPEVVPIVADALAHSPRWAATFRRYVPKDEAALRNYLALRRQAGFRERWDSDAQLVAALTQKGLFREAFATWREIEGADADRFGFVTGDSFAPIGWQLVVRGDRVAHIADDGTMTVSVERGAGGELARQLLQLAPGRYRLETRIASTDADPPLWVALPCASAPDAPRQPLKAHVEFTVGEGGCPAHWLILGASALESRHGVEAKLARWRFTRGEQE
jgi:hypothetical protein